MVVWAVVQMLANEKSLDVFNRRKKLTPYSWVCYQLLFTIQGINAEEYHKKNCNLLHTQVLVTIQIICLFQQPSNMKTFTPPPHLHRESWETRLGSWSLIALYFLRGRSLFKMRRFKKFYHVNNKMCSILQCRVKINPIRHLENATKWKTDRNCCSITVLQLGDMALYFYRLYHETQYIPQDVHNQISQ